MEIRSWLDHASGEKCLVFFDDRPPDKIVYNFFTGEIKAVSPGEKVPPEFIFRIPFGLQGDFGKALANLAAEEGGRTESESRIEGSLEATRHHLEDLRRLLKLRKD
jgi:hypothetical protein